MSGSSGSGKPAVLRLFGHAALERGGDSAPLRVPSKAVALLGILTANHARAVNRDWLAQTLWPDVEPSDGRANLRRHLHLLTKVLGEDAFALTRQTAQWNPEARVAVDAIEFDRNVSADPASAVPYYTGDFCAGVADETLDVLRSRFRSRFERALGFLRTQAAAPGNEHDLLRWLEMLIAHDPLDEQAARELIELRYGLGDRGGALREYHALAARLASELGIEPEPETAALLERMLPAAQKPSSPHNLLSPATSFVGRDHELSRINDSLKPSVAVALVGTGGIGKSRLALRAAWNNLSRFAGGVWFVELAPAEDDTAIWQRIAGACGVSIKDDPAQSVLRHLDRAQPLIVLDNCEHILADAAAVITQIVTKTKAAVLATSRKALHVPGEIAIEVAPLQTPPETPKSADDLLRFSGSRLFLERAAVVAPAFEVGEREAARIADIVRRLDGLPLAIELVAARANMMTLDAMAKKIAERPDDFRAKRSRSESRHETVRAAVDWSYALLGEYERRVFARLSVFAASWDLEACEAICGDEQRGVFSALSELVEASMAVAQTQRGVPRYDLLETLRHYASDVLAQSGERDRIEQRFVAYYKDIATRLSPLGGTQTTAAYVEMVEPDYPNFVRAVQTAMRLQHYEDAAILAIGLTRYWVTMNSLEGDAVVADLLARNVQERLPAVTAAHLCRSRGYFSNARGAWDEARRWNRQAARLFSEAGREAEAIDAEVAIAYADSYTGTPLIETVARYKDFLERTRATGIESAVAKLQADLGAMHQALDKFEDARAFLLEALASFKRFGRMDQAASTLCILSRTYASLDCKDEALACLQEGVAIFESLSDHANLGEALRCRARLERLDDPRRALATMVQSLRRLERAFEPRFVIHALDELAEILMMLGLPERAARVHGSAMQVRKQYNFKLDYRGMLGDRLEEWLANPASATWVELGSTMSVTDVRALAEEALEPQPGAAGGG